MKYIDFHCDTLYRLLYKEYVSTGNTLEKNEGHIDLSRLNIGGTISQCFACFVNTNAVPVTASHYNDIHAMIDILEGGVARDKEYIISTENIAKSIEDSIQGDIETICVITLEDGGVIEGSLDRLIELYNRGVRIITLTWNHENCIGFPNKDYEFKENGLKPFGIEVIKKMDELGIVVDVSHLSDGGFYDVVKYGTRPFIATHSNAREVMNHSRNLTDDMIRAISKRGGVIGLNYYGAFLQESGICTFEIMCKHIEHIINIGGEDIICLGSDFDGIDCELPMEGCEDLDSFSQAMREYGFREEFVEKICYKNAIEFYNRYEKSLR